MKAGVIVLLALALASTARADWQSVFGHLNLDYPGLEAVKAAVGASDLPTAAVELKAYYQMRVEPHYITDRHARPEPNPDYNTSGADRVLKREYAFVGKPATLTHDIDWNADPLSDVEWPIELNRHGTWVRLARTYWYTGDEKYAEDFAYQLGDWLSDNPRPDGPRNARWTWRTLELGIRLKGSWPDVLFRFIDSDHFTPQLVCAMLEAIYQQADYLGEFGGGGNWLVSEKSGKLSASIVFPEFADAEGWQAECWEVLTREIQAQVLPDGAQIELTPHYHSATLSSFRSAYDIAAQNGVEVPEVYHDQMLSMYEYLMNVVKPDGHIPMFNDSDHGNMKGWMRDGAERFDREDMRFIATGGEEGVPPEGPSHAFRNAGQYVMRSGWTMDDIYFAIDAGPYGYAHQHEDKLTIDLWAFGQEMILDPGRFTYAGRWRGHFVSTAAHSTVLIDGHGQNRRRTPRDTWVAREPLHNIWETTDAYDYVCGSYDEGYAGGHDAIHVRKVLFVKPSDSRPGHVVVKDLILPRDAGPAEVSATCQFQLARAGAQLNEQTRAVNSVGPGANVLVVPFETDGLEVELVEGEEESMAGWIGWSLHAANKTPATLVKYTRTGALPLEFTTVLVPYQGEDAPDFGSLGIDLPVFPSGFQASDLAPIDLDSAAIDVAATGPALFQLRYGYAAGGGCLFETRSDEPSTEATLQIQNARVGLPYTYQVSAKAADWRVIQQGTILIPQPRAFDFEDGTLQGWIGSSASIVEGFANSDGAVRIESAAVAEASYLQLGREHRMVTGADPVLGFAYRASIAEAGDWFYIKVTLRDADGADWSSYFANRPSDDWREMHLSLASFRGDTTDHPMHGKPMPEGIKITRVGFILRKGVTGEPVAPALEIDNIAISE